MYHRIKKEEFGHFGLWDATNNPSKFFTPPWILTNRYPTWRHVWSRRYIFHGASNFGCLLVTVNFRWILANSIRAFSRWFQDAYRYDELRPHRSTTTMDDCYRNPHSQMQGTYWPSHSCLPCNFAQVSDVCVMLLLQRTISYAGNPCSRIVSSISCNSLHFLLHHANNRTTSGDFWSFWCSSAAHWYLYMGNKQTILGSNCSPNSFLGNVGTSFDAKVYYFHWAEE